MGKIFYVMHTIIMAVRTKVLATYAIQLPTARGKMWTVALPIQRQTFYNFSRTDHLVEENQFLLVVFQLKYKANSLIKI